MKIETIGNIEVYTTDDAPEFNKGRLFRLTSPRGKIIFVLGTAHIRDVPVTAELLSIMSICKAFYFEVVRENSYKLRLNELIGYFEIGDCIPNLHSIGYNPELEIVKNEIINFVTIIIENTDAQSFFPKNWQQKLNTIPIVMLKDIYQFSSKLCSEIVNNPNISISNFQADNPPAHDSELDDYFSDFDRKLIYIASLFQNRSPAIKIKGLENGSSRFIALLQSANYIEESDKAKQELIKYGTNILSKRTAKSTWNGFTEYVTSTIKYMHEKLQLFPERAHCSQFTHDPLMNEHDMQMDLYQDLFVKELYRLTDVININNVSMSFFSQDKNEYHVIRSQHMFRKLLTKMQEKNILACVGISHLFDANGFLKLAQRSGLKVEMIYETPNLPMLSRLTSFRRNRVLNGIFKGSLKQFFLVSLIMGLVSRTKLRAMEKNYIKLAIMLTWGIPYLHTIKRAYNRLNIQENECHSLALAANKPAIIENDKWKQRVNDLYFSANAHNKGTPLELIRGSNEILTAEPIRNANSLII